MDSTGMGHAISMNWWSDLVSMDRKFMARWLNSPLKSLYYSLQVMENTQDKSNVSAGLDSSEFDQSEFDVLFGADNEPTMCTSCSE
jgi:hypothetical protein